MSRKLKLLIALVTFGALAAVAVAASSPSVSTGDATSIKPKSAIVHGTVNPNGARTTYRFQWGLTTAYGSDGPARSAGSGTKPVAVSLTLSGLLPGTRYHYRLTASNRVGSAVGADRTFRTRGNPPAIAATGPVTALSEHTATVTAVINPNGQQTTWYFQYGLSTSYTSQTVPQILPAGKKPVTVAQQLLALQAGTVFHYRIVAVNRGIHEAGNDATFMTFPAHRPTPGLRARTRPRRDRRRPFTFTTTGRLIPPSSIPSQFGCAGRVRVRFMLGRHRVARSFAAVQPNCTFSAPTIFAHKPGHRRGAVTLRVLIRYLGTGYLRTRGVRAKRVTLG